MVVQHNLQAANTNRQLGITTSAQAKSTEKLSSGYKINRAADDAAGLSISEKMRSQIRGLSHVNEFGPLIVSIDAEGRNLFEENKVIFNERKEKAIEEICKHVGFIK